jgi:hypothetical protein
MSHRSYSWGLGGGLDGFPEKLPPCGKILIAERAMPLEARNEFDLPASTYYVCAGYEPETGRRVAAWVSRYEKRYVAILRRDYDQTTSALRREARFDFVKHDGTKVGAKTDSWYRKTVRAFDTASGKVTSEEIFRYDQDKVPDRRWVKIER